MDFDARSTNIFLSATRFLIPGDLEANIFEQQLRGKWPLMRKMEIYLAQQIYIYVLSL